MQFRPSGIGNSHMRLSIVVPVYNEAERLPRSLEKMISFFRKKKISFEVVVVNDGSTDGSEDIISKYQQKYREIVTVRYSANRGKGYAVRRGVAKSCGELILFSDADLSTPISEFEKFLKPIQAGYDIVIGSRRKKGADIRIHQPLHRRILGIGFGALTELAFLRGIKDSQCGFKLFRSDIAKEAFKKQTVDGFSFDVELLYIARKKLKARIKEIPVVWRDSARHSKVRVRKETFRMLKDLYKIKVRH